jgi:hypothetical protein
MSGRASSVTTSAAAAVLLGWLATRVVSTPSETADLLLISLVPVTALLIVTARRLGVLNPAFLATLGVAIYFPIRGLVVVFGHITPGNGLNARVAMALTSGSDHAAAVISVVICCSYSLGLSVLLLVRPRPGAQPRVNDPGFSRLGWALMVGGLAAQAASVPSSFAFLHNASPNAGSLSQLATIPAFGLGIGLILVSGERVPRPAWWFVAGSLICGVIGGSKNLLVTDILAVLVALPPVRRSVPVRRSLLMGLIAVVLIFGVFPSLANYRRELRTGLGPTAAAARLPSDLNSRAAVSGLPRSGSTRAYVGDALFYLTYRFSGFDSIALVASAPPNPSLLPLSRVLFLPLEAIVPAHIVTGSRRSVGEVFAHEYWGLPASDNTHVAITAPGEAYAVAGLAFVGIVALAFGIAAAAAGAMCRSAMTTTRTYGYILATAALAIERDLSTVVGTVSRELAFAFVLFAVTRLTRPAPVRSRSGELPMPRGPGGATIEVARPARSAWTGHSEWNAS